MIDWTQLRPQDLPGDLREVAELFDDDVPETGMEIVERLVQNFGGARIYVSFLSELRSATKSSQIAGEFTGRNTGALAANHEVTRRHVQKVVKRRDALFFEAFDGTNAQALAEELDVHPQYLPRLIHRSEKSRPGLFDE